jgi:hypothetical protein
MWIDKSWASGDELLFLEQGFVAVDIHFPKRLFVFLPMKDSLHCLNADTQVLLGRFAGS